MQSAISKWIFGASATLALISCTAAKQAQTSAQTSASTTSAAVAGWYMQHAGQNTFQPCGLSEQWRIGMAADLAARAKAFGLDDDNPVYVRLQATLNPSDKSIDVARVDQFGSPTPVRDCAMEGVVHSSNPPTQ